jgi:hypothetical protein
MDRYIGLDVHSASCTAAVVSANGKRLSSTVLETNGKILVEFLRLIPGDRHLIVEEGTHAARMQPGYTRYCRSMGYGLGVIWVGGQALRLATYLSLWWFVHRVGLMNKQVGNKLNMSEVALSRAVSRVRREVKENEVRQ